MTDNETHLFSHRPSAIDYCEKLLASDNRVFLAFGEGTGKWLVSTKPFYFISPQWEYHGAGKMIRHG